MGVIDEEICDKDCIIKIKNDCLLLKLIIQNSNLPKTKNNRRVGVNNVFLFIVQ